MNDDSISVQVQLYMFVFSAIANNIQTLLIHHKRIRQNLREIGY